MAVALRIRFGGRLPPYATGVRRSPLCRTRHRQAPSVIGHRASVIGWQGRPDGGCRRSTTEDRSPTEYWSEIMNKPDPYIVALDIGTSKVCVLVGEVNDRGQLEIIGKGTAPMRGTRRGNIINLDQAVEAVKRAVDEAEVMAGLEIEAGYVGVAGDQIRS